LMFFKTTHRKETNHQWK